MGQMDALTELELAAARRREVVLEERGYVRARREVEYLEGRRNLGWLTATVTAAVARTPPARG